MSGCEGGGVVRSGGRLTLLGQVNDSGGKWRKVGVCGCRWGLMDASRGKWTMQTGASGCQWMQVSHAKVSVNQQGQVGGIVSMGG